MTPLRISARLDTGLALPGGQPIHLDALLAWAELTRSGHLLAPQARDELVSIELPLAWDERGFWRASAMVGSVDFVDGRWLQRRFPLDELRLLGDRKINRVNLAAGRQKNYRLPRTQLFFLGDEVSWYAEGDSDEVADLLSWVTHLGHRHGAGWGRLTCARDPWEVEECETWPGFPVVAEGIPLRSLPADYPGVGDGHRRGMGRLVPPYWLRDGEVDVVHAAGVEMPA